ncbi:hypothetical protein RB195_011607 [Necator americanus]|uniref:Uncharacterized protein n=1 Tax=Necator americanus TaxID=51031 RepID=A0ABR1D373_NECAM
MIFDGLETFDKVLIPSLGGDGDLKRLDIDNSGSTWVQRLDMGSVVRDGGSGSTTAARQQRLDMTAARHGVLRLDMGSGSTSSGSTWLWL